MSKVQYHVGCGRRNFGPDWIHVDGHAFSHVESHNIGLFNEPGDHADLIYASHLIAYFDRIEIISILNQWRRVLKPGGVLKIGTPDMMVMAKLYGSCETVAIEQIMGPIWGKMKMGDQFIYHKTGYDEKSLTELLQSNGFSNIIPFDHKETGHDDHCAAYINGTLISLNLQCKKVI